MTYEEIQKRVNDLSAAMLAKEMSQPRAQLMIKANEELTVYMEWADKSTTYGTSYDCVRAANPAEAFSKAEAFIAARPSAEQARMNEFLGVLGKAIDLGNQYGIDADYMNPLVASMKKLSENIITFQGEASNAHQD